MKKLLSLGLMIGLLSLNGFTVNAAETINTPNQAADYLLLGLLDNEINKAVANYYHENNVGMGTSSSTDSIFIQYGHGNTKDYVNVLQSEKGHELESSYVVKIDITPQKKKRILGRDTLSFGIEPKNKISNVEVKLLDYKHTSPSNNH